MTARVVAIIAGTANLFDLPGLLADGSEYDR